MMKRTCLALLFLLSCASPPSSAPASTSAPIEDEPLQAQVRLRLLHRSFSESHFQRPPTDDKLSNRLFDLYLQKLDAHKRVFIQADYEALRGARDSLDEQLKEGRYAFFRDAYTRQVEREATLSTWCEALTKEPFDFTVKEELLHAPKDYAKDLDELNDRWRRTLKSWTLARLVEAIETQEKNPSAPRKELNLMEAEARLDAQKQCADIFSRMERYTVEERRAVYLDTIAAVYDPHSGFYPPTEKASFEAKATGSLQGIGVTLREKDGDLVVSRIISGSPADVQGELAVGDVLLSVARDKEAAVEVVGGDAQEVGLLLLGDKGTRLTLKIKKPDNVIKELTLVCALILLEEAYAKAALLIRGKQKVALIQLPSFYADANAGGHKSAEDISNTLQKLKKEGVSRLILDLRGNVGGSLKEAIAIAGLFLPGGPIVQIKDSEGKLSLLEDKDSTAQFSGALVLLLDQASASAAEVLAAAIQDYQRGVLVGGKTSYGKGTAQYMIDLDLLLPADAKDLSPLGAIKITLEKFYRINGGSTQLKGVTPDIILPNEYTYSRYGEALLKDPMPWDELKATPYQIVTPSYSLTKLQEQSAARVKAHKIFQLADENAQRLKRNSARTSTPLQLEAYREEKRLADEEVKRFIGVLTPSEGLKVSTLASDKASFAKLAPIHKARLEKWQRQALSDPYIEEALYILDDMK